jgi:hypothetical protein
MPVKQADLVFRKKQLYKLVVARSDIAAAVNACDLFISRVKNVGDDLYFPLLNAIVVCYSRPFSTNRPFGSLPNKWHKFANKKYQALHEKLIDLRDKIIAHSDLEIRKVYIYPKGTFIGKNGQRELKTANLGVAITNTVLPVEVFSDIRATCFDLGLRLNAEVEKQLHSLYGNTSFPPGQFELEFD